MTIQGIKYEIKFIHNMRKGDEKKKIKLSQLFNIEFIIIINLFNFFILIIVLELLINVIYIRNIE